MALWPDWCQKGDKSVWPGWVIHPPWYLGHGVSPIQTTWIEREWGVHHGGNLGTVTKTERIVDTGQVKAVINLTWFSDYLLCRNLVSHLNSLAHSFSSIKWEIGLESIEESFEGFVRTLSWAPSPEILTWAQEFDFLSSTWWRWCWSGDHTWSNMGLDDDSVPDILWVMGNLHFETPSWEFSFCPCCGKQYKQDKNIRTTGVNSQFASHHWEYWPNRMLL